VEVEKLSVFSWSDVPIEIRHPNIGEVRSIELGLLTLELSKVRAGFDTSELLKGLPDDLCPVAHWGYVIRGGFRLRTAESEERVYAGQSYYTRPGHTLIVEEDCQVVDLSLTEERRIRTEHFRRKLAGEPE
jgi:hypothetical protein